MPLTCFGHVAHRITNEYVALTDDWPQAALEDEVTGKPVEVFTGFDYGQADAVAVLSDVDLGTGEPD